MKGLRLMLRFRRVIAIASATAIALGLSAPMAFADEQASDDNDIIVVDPAPEPEPPAPAPEVKPEPAPAPAEPAPAPKKEEPPAPPPAPEPAAESEPAPTPAPAEPAAEPEVESATPVADTVPVEDSAPVGVALEEATSTEGPAPAEGPDVKAGDPTLTADPEVLTSTTISARVCTDGPLVDLVIGLYADGGVSTIDQRVIYSPVAGDCLSGTFTGLTPGARYSLEYSGLTYIGGAVGLPEVTVTLPLTDPDPDVNITLSTDFGLPTAVFTLTADDNPASLGTCRLVSYDPVTDMADTVGHFGLFVGNVATTTYPSDSLTPGVTYDFTAYCGAKASNTVPFTVPLAVTVVSVEDSFTTSTIAGTTPVLPAMATVTWSDSSTTEEAIAWETVDPASYAAPGTFTVNGTVSVDGTDYPVTVTVTVTAAPIVVQPSGVATKKDDCRWLVNIANPSEAGVYYEVSWVFEGTTYGPYDLVKGGDPVAIPSYQLPSRMYVKAVAEAGYVFDGTSTTSWDSNNPAISGCPTEQEIPVPAGVMTYTQASCFDLDGFYQLTLTTGVSHFEDADGNVLPLTGNLGADPVEVYIVAADGYVFDSGAHRVHLGTLPAIVEPTGCETPVVLVHPELKPGVCQADGTATSATVYVPVQIGVHHFMVNGVNLWPGGTISVPYGTEIHWSVVLADGYVLDAGSIGSGIFAALTAPDCGGSGGGDDPTPTPPPGPTPDPTPTPTPVPPAQDQTPPPGAGGDVVKTATPLVVVTADGRLPATGANAALGWAGALLAAAGALALIAARRRRMN